MIPELRLIFSLLIFGPVITAIVGFAYLLFKDPSKLQSEEFQIRQQALELIKSKGSGFAVSPVQIEAISNPANPIEDRGE